MTIHTLRSISRGSRKSRKANGSNAQYPRSLFDQLHYGKNVDGCQRSLCEVKIRIPEKRVGGSIGHNAEQMTRDSGRIEGSLSRLTLTKAKGTSHDHGHTFNLKFLSWIGSFITIYFFITVTIVF